ncbi:MAG: MBL fold metallo-hydrolase [Opitutae bacterium]|nr:MBL fold metallo-hydrolase [Opitutae bacterium]
MMTPMNRRSALKALSLGALAASVNPRLSASPESREGTRFANSAIYRFRIGNHDAFAIQCGSLTIKPEWPSFATEPSADEFAAAVRETIPTGTLRMPFNVLLLDWNGTYVLIDSGEPGHAGAPPPVVALLGELGIAPDRIAHVVLTHAHFDHLGGLVDGAERPVFPKARHHAFKAEADFWTAPHPDVSKVRLDTTDMIRVARRVFARIAFEFPNPGAEIVPGITAFSSPGHTPGHMTLRLTSGPSTLYHISDLCHHARLLLEHASWSIASDVDPVLAVKTRKEIFRNLSETRERIFGFHMPFPGLGYLAKSATGFRWLPEDWIPDNA